MAIINGNANDNILNGTRYRDIISGKGGDDTINAKGGFDELYGGSGKDTLNGGGKSDILDGGTGDDVLNGDGGNDYFSDAAGNNVFDGGAGTDTATFDDPVIIFDGKAYSGNDVFAWYFDFDDEAFPDAITELVSVERVFGSGSDDQIAHGNGAAGVYVNGRGGDDDLLGSDGNDRLLGGAGDNFLRDGEGNDVLRALNGDDRLEGGAGNDRLNAKGGDDRLEGGAGDDVLSAGAGKDFLDGGEGDDRLFGGGGVDLIDGGAGDDYMVGGAGSDRFNGGDGSDRFVAGTGAADVFDFGLIEAGAVDVDADRIDNFDAADHALSIIMYFTDDDQRFSIEARDFLDSNDDGRIDGGDSEVSVARTVISSWISGQCISEVAARISAYSNSPSRVSPRASMPIACSTACPMMLGRPSRSSSRTG